MADYKGTLRKLSDVDDLEVAHDDPDVRGWDIVDAGDRVVGEVEDLIVDPAAMKVRFIVAELDAGELELSDTRRVLIPIASAQLDRNDEQVVLSGMDRSALLELTNADDEQWESRATSMTGSVPSYPASSSSTTSSTAAPASRIPDTTANSTRLTRSAEELRIGKREVEAGEVRIGKHVESEHVRQPVTTTHERVKVERRPVSGESMRADASISESGEIRVPVVEEEVVVDKRPVVKEEIVVSKEVVSRTKDVEADVRREEFDIEKTGRVDVDESEGKGRVR